MNIKEIALRIASEIPMEERFSVETICMYACTALLAELSKDAEPECPYPCGWKNLHSIIISRGAYLTRAIDPDEVGDEPWKAIMDVVLYAKALCEHGMKAQPVEAIEQRVAEACVALCKFHEETGTDPAFAIRNGQWKEFVK